MACEETTAQEVVDAETQRHIDDYFQAMTSAVKVNRPEATKPEDSPPPKRFQCTKPAESAFAIDQQPCTCPICGLVFLGYLMDEHSREVRRTSQTHAQDKFNSEFFLVWGLGERREKIHEAPPFFVPGVFISLPLFCWL